MFRKIPQRGRAGAGKLELGPEAKADDLAVVNFLSADVSKLVAKAVNCTLIRQFDTLFAVPKTSRTPEHGGARRREDGVTKIEVHVAGICARESEDGWRILAAKRASDRHLFPEKWECGGGMVQSGESFESALKRQMFEEFGLHVQPWFIVEAYEIHVATPQKIIPGVRFVCLSQEGKVNLNKREFSTSKWVELPLREQLDWIDGLERAIKQITPRIVAKAGTEDFADFDNGNGDEV